MALTDQFQTLGTELNSQYQVTYARPRTLIPPRTRGQREAPGPDGSGAALAVRNATIATAAPTIASAA